MIRNALGVVLGITIAAGCTSLDRYAVAETHRLSRAPYYRTIVPGVKPVADSVVVLPVRLQNDLAASLMYGGRVQEFDPLLDALNARLGAAHACCGPDDASPSGNAPRLYIGIAGGELAPPETEEQRLPTDLMPPMVLHVERPDEVWREALRSLVAARGGQWALHLQLGISQYPKGRQGLVRKQVTLGSGHVQPIRFLTAEDKPVEVLHLTGVLLDADGRIVRAGAEGIIARDTPFSAQIFEVSKALDDLDLAAALETERRDDLPGSPLKWEVALDNLIAQLTFGRVLVPAAP